jgi:2-phosphosulfolactate phosphatase
MSAIDVRIIRGAAGEYPASDINIVIDVIRAFTVSHVAFLRGAREFLLVNTAEEAFALKAQNPAYLLAGEVAGLPIAGFDLDNSPHTFSQAVIEDKSVVQKTSNGVKATLLALNADTILVTGLSNAKNSARHARQIAGNLPRCSVNIIASHPDYDDDLACAEYIRDHLLGLNTVKLEDVQNRIINSQPAQKFFDPQAPAFDERDIALCAREVPCDFVMQVDTHSALPRIVRKPV